MRRNDCGIFTIFVPRRLIGWNPQQITDSPERSHLSRINSPTSSSMRSCDSNISQTSLNSKHNHHHHQHRLTKDNQPHHHQLHISNQQTQILIKEEKEQQVKSHPNNNSTRTPRPQSSHPRLTNDKSYSSTYQPQKIPLGQSFSPIRSLIMQNQCEIVTPHESSESTSKKNKAKKKPNLKKTLSTSASPKRVFKKPRELEEQQYPYKIFFSNHKDISPPPSKVAQVIQSSYKATSSNHLNSNRSSQSSKASLQQINSQRILDIPKIEQQPLFPKKPKQDNQQKTEQITNRSIHHSIKTIPVKNLLNSDRITSAQISPSSSSSKSSFFESKSTIQKQQEQYQKEYFRPTSSSTADASAKPKSLTRSIIDSSNRSSPHIRVSPQRIALTTSQCPSRAKLQKHSNNSEVITKVSAITQKKQSQQKSCGFNKRYDDIKRIITNLKDKNTHINPRSKYPENVQHAERLQLLYRNKSAFSSQQPQSQKLIILHFNYLLGHLNRPFFEKQSQSSTQIENNSYNFDESTTNLQSIDQLTSEEISSGLFISNNLVEILASIKQKNHFVVIILPKLTYEWKSQKKSIITHLSTCCSAIYSIRSSSDYFQDLTIATTAKTKPALNKVNLIKSMHQFSSGSKIKSTSSSLSSSPKAWGNESTNIVILSKKVEKRQTSNKLNGVLNVHASNQSSKDGSLESIQSEKITQQQQNQQSQNLAGWSQKRFRFCQREDSSTSHRHKETETKLFIDYSSIYEDLRISENLNSVIIIESMNGIQIDTPTDLNPTINNQDTNYQDRLKQYNKDLINTQVRNDSWKQFLGKFPILMEQQDIQVKIVFVMSNQLDRFSLPDSRILTRIIEGGSEKSRNYLVDDSSSHDDNLYEIDSFDEINNDNNNPNLDESCLSASYENSQLNRAFENATYCNRMIQLNIQCVLDRIKEEKDILLFVQETQKDFRSKQQQNHLLSSDYSSESAMKANILKQLLQGKQSLPMFKGILEHLTQQKEPSKQGVEIARRMASHYLSFLTDSLIARNFRNQRQQQSNLSGFFEAQETPFSFNDHFEKQNRTISFERKEKWTKDLPLTSIFSNSFYLFLVNP